MAKFCVRCGNEVPEGNNVCTNCGTPVNNAPVNSAPVAQAQPGTTVVVNQPATQPAKSNGMAITGFIISLVSMILCCGSLSLISLIFSIIGVTKAKDCGGNGKGLAIAGIIISVIGMIVLVIVSIFYSAAIISTLEESGYSY